MSKNQRWNSREELKDPVKSVLFYGDESWTLTRKLKRRLDGTSTKTIRTVFLGIIWNEWMMNADVYDDLKKRL